MKTLERLFERRETFLSSTDMLKQLRDRIKARRRDKQSRARFGANAPLYAQQIQVNTAEIKHFLTVGYGRSTSGQVVDSDWDRQIAPLSHSPKVAYTIAHFRDGLSWNDSGAVSFMQDRIAERGSFDGCRTATDIEVRLAKLDRLYDVVAADGYLTEIGKCKRAFRESGGILIHLGRGGEPIFGGAGHHRLGIAIALNLPRIPAQIGIVHPGALGRFG